MATSLDVVQLVRISRELLFMGWRGVHRRRLGILALDLLLARDAALRLAQRAPSSTAEDRAQRVLAFIKRLEEQVIRLYATHEAGPPGFAGLLPGYASRRR